MEKQIFKVGDKVYHFRHGCGKVIYCEEGAVYSILVEFINFKKKEWFTGLGYDLPYDQHPTLSFTEYTLQGFSQERPINYEDYKGKWCVFWDDNFSYKIIRKFVKYIERSDGLNFIADNRTHYRYCKLLSDEMVKELELDETFKSR